ncbi:MAG: glycosyltransferase family 4 protein [Candidatus Edwardsbacteria bacterium]
MFANTLANELGIRVDIFYIDSTGMKRLQKLKRHFNYFIVAIKAFLHRHNYDYIIFWQQFIGFYYATMARFFRSKMRNPTTLVLPLIYKQRRKLFGKTYKGLFRFFLDLNTLNWFICHSAREREFYIKEFGANYQERIHFVPYGIKMPETDSFVNNIVDKSRYFFSGGTSNRDYGTLIEAFRELNERLKIACFRGDIKNLHIPSNIEVFHNVFGNEFLYYMGNAYGVVISLDAPNISSGQLVLLDAMRLGKAIIITRSNGIEDYLDTSCAILVEPHSAEDIRNAVRNLVNNKGKLCLLAANAYRKYEANFTIEKYGKRIATILKGNI